MTMRLSSTACLLGLFLCTTTAALLALTSAMPANDDAPLSVRLLLMSGAEVAVEVASAQVSLLELKKPFGVKVN